MRPILNTAQFEFSTIQLSTSQDMRAADAARDMLADNPNVPMLPDVARHVLDSFGNEWITAQEVAELLEKDPTISARLLGLANSAYFARGTVYSVEEAVLRVLGLDLARGIAIGIACKQTFTYALCPGFDVTRFWSSALANALIAKELTQLSSETQLDGSACSLFGLISDIGHLGFLACAPQDYNALIEDHRPGPGQLGDLLKQTFGCTPHDLGGALAELWQLPASILGAFNESAAGYATPTPSIAGIVWLAKILRKHPPNRLPSMPLVQQLVLALGLRNQLDQVCPDEAQKQSELIAQSFAA